jgi:hypothetical protein
LGFRSHSLIHTVLAEVSLELESHIYFTPAHILLLTHMKCSYWYWFKKLQSKQSHLMSRMGSLHIPCSNRFPPTHQENSASLMIIMLYQERGYFH